MNKELELLQFVETQLQRNQKVVLMVVVQSLGSSPGRPGFKMAVAEDGTLFGSIGGGVMAGGYRAELAGARALDVEPPAPAVEQFEVGGQRPAEVPWRVDAPTAAGGDEGDAFLVVPAERHIERGDEGPHRGSHRGVG